jgi:hypothetical protein
MERRHHLFESITMPSVLGQMNQEFSWLVLIDERTPPLRFHERITVMRCPPYRSLRPVIPYLKGLCAGAYLITSRLDNDDAIHRDYVQAVQDHAELSHGICVNFPRQLYLGTRSRQVTLYDNPFTNNTVSLVEAGIGEVKTVYLKSHHEIGRVAAVRNNGTTEAMSLLTIHGENLGNRLLGETQARPRLLLEGYPFLLSDNGAPDHGPGPGDPPAWMSCPEPFPSGAAATVSPRLR